jgi:hypothetical protein
MKIVMTLLARDEADVVEAQLAYHLAAGVDFVVATDNRSRDGTTDILAAHAREGHLHLLREDGERFEQSAWVTRMARLAATRFGADWVVNSDADEFWWPRGGDLKDVLAAVPPQYGVLRAPIRHFFLRPGGGFFSERMVLRPLLSAPVNEPGNPLRPNTHVLHRGDPHATVAAGNHAVDGGTRLSVFPGWHPIECLHFPLRSLEQAHRKYANWIASLAGSEYEDAFEAHERGQLDEFIRDKVLDDDVVEQGLAEGSLVEDPRIRQALRELAGVEELLDPTPVFPHGTRRLPFAPSTEEEDAAYAAELAVLDEADTVRLQRRLDELEARLALLERRRWGRLPRVLARRRRTRSEEGRDRRPR